MKIKQIEQTANIGSSIELSNVELVVLKTKIEKVKHLLINEDGIVTSNLKLNNTDKIEISSLFIFLDKLTNDVLSLKETHNELFDIPATDKTIDDKIKEIGKVHIHQLESND